MSETQSGAVNHIDLLTYTSDIVSAHVSNNAVSPADVPNLIREVYKSLSEMGSGASQTEELPTPAVPIKKSVRPDYIICLEDGKKLKMLKRHLKTAYNMTPEEYRDRWGLSPDYPMVAPNYAEQRSQLAKQIGLGTRAKPAETKASSSDAGSDTAKSAPKRRGRTPKKAAAAAS